MAASGAGVLRNQHDNVISTANAEVATAVKVNAELSTAQNSWSDEWYSVHKTIPDSASEDAQAL